MAKSRAESDLEAYRSGELELDELAKRWTRPMQPVPEVEKTIEGIEMGGAEEKLMGGVGTWDEIVEFYLIGRLSWEEYHHISKYVDAAVG